MLQLGNWQLSRAQEKESRQEQLDSLSQEPPIDLPDFLVKLEDFKYRQVEARGEYLPRQTIYLDNKIYKGVAGYQIITPLRIGKSSMHVLVNPSPGGPNRAPDHRPIRPSAISLLAAAAAR